MNILDLEAVTAAPWKGPLLQDISFSLGPGKVLGLAGPNGAGKSSLLRIISGDLQADAGSITFCECALDDWKPRARAQNLAVLPQLSLLNFPYSVEEVILLGRIPHRSGIEKDREILSLMMDRFDLVEQKNKLYTQLSGGEKQRVQLARVFAQLEADTLEGKLLLLDEPTSALDLAHQQQVLDAVREIAARGCAVILVLHDLNLAASVSDDILILHEGRNAALGSPRDVLTADMFRSVFSVEVSLNEEPHNNTPFFTTRGLS